MFRIGCNLFKEESSSTTKVWIGLMHCIPCRADVLGFRSSSAGRILAYYWRLAFALDTLGNRRSKQEKRWKRTET